MTKEAKEPRAVNTKRRRTKPATKRKRHTERRTKKGRAAKTMDRPDNTGSRRMGTQQAPTDNKARKLPEVPEDNNDSSKAE